MGKRKRSKSRDRDSSKRLRKENKRLKEKLKKQQRLESTSSSSSSCVSIPTTSRVDSKERELASEIMENSIILSPMHTDEVAEEVEVIDANVDQTSADKAPEPEIDPEILHILGDDPTNENRFGENLNKHIMPRWQHILLKGLDKEVKAELCKQYLPPENCPNLRAPKLNPQVNRLLTDANKTKERFNEIKQNQLSSSLAALGKALNIAISQKENLQPQEIIKPLSDAARLLCDFHYRESQSRRFAIINVNVIHKDMRETLRSTNIDEFLFGADLAEQVKLDKEMSKVANDLRASRPTFKPPATSQAQRGTLNYRGGRGASSVPPRQYPTQRPPPTTPYRGAATASRGREHHRYEPSSSRRTSVRGRSTRR